MWKQNPLARRFDQTSMCDRVQWADHTQLVNILTRQDQCVCVAHGNLADASTGGNAARAACNRRGPAVIIGRLVVVANDVNASN